MATSIRNGSQDPEDFIAWMRDQSATATSRGARVSPRLTPATEWGSLVIATAIGLALVVAKSAHLLLVPDVGPAETTVRQAVLVTGATGSGDLARRVRLDTAAWRGRHGRSDVVPRWPQPGRAAPRRRNRE